MKKCLMVMILVLLAGSAWAQRTMNVQVREGQLRNRASFLGTVTANLAYGETVTIRQKQTAWYEVATATGKTGWIHESALTTKRLVAGSGVDDARVGASGSEIALAGKGFSAEVEAEYKKQNRNLDFSWVDRMGQFDVPPARRVEFLVQGGLAK